MIYSNATGTEADSSVLDRVSYLEARKLGAPSYRKFMKPNAKVILPLLEESEKENENFPKVYLRIKPYSCRKDAQKFVIKDKITLTADAPCESLGNNSFRSVGRTVKHQYKFSGIFTHTSSQKELFRETCLAPLKCFMKGENCLLFAYGATGSGKTYTIQGTEENPGIIPQSINMIFSTLKGRLHSDCQYKPFRLESVVQLNEEQQLEELQVKESLLRCPLPLSNVYTLESPLINSLKTSMDFQSPSFQVMKSHLDEIILNIEDEKSVNFSLWVSFYEIHNETIYDLLEVSHGCDVKRKPLSLGYTNGSAYIKGLCQVCVFSSDEAYQVYVVGRNNLKKAATNLNSESSRSHCVFSITMIRILNVELPQAVKVSIFSCVDLAGSERVKKTLSVGDRLRESQNINTSLHVLSRCLSIIRDNQKSQRKLRVPFRDSKLTQIFQYALTGNQGIAMIVNITLDPSMYCETVNVLKFSAVAREIVVEPQQNNSSHFLQFTSMLSHKPSLIKSTDTFNGSTFSQPVDCNHMVDIMRLQQQLEKECEKNSKLTEQLEREQKRARDIDAHLRAELTGEFSLILQRTEDFCKKQMESAVEDEKDMAKFREAKLKEFYEKQLQKANDEVKVLHATVISLQERMAVMEEENIMLKASLETSVRNQHVLEEQIGAGEPDLVPILRKQLKAASDEMERKYIENHNLIAQIAETKDDLIILERDKEYLLEELDFVSNSLVEEVEQKPKPTDTCDVINISDSDSDVIGD